MAAIDIPIIHFSVEWWRGLHQTATIGSPDRVLDPAAPMAFVGTLLGTLGAFTLAWLYLDDPPLPAGADRGGARGGAAPRPDHERANGGGGPMTDVGFVIAAYAVIIGGLAAYTLALWQRLRAARGRDDEAR